MRSRLLACLFFLGVFLMGGGAAGAAGFGQNPAMPAYGLFPADQFVVTSGACPDCTALPQALWYFRDETIAVPKPGVLLAGFEPALSVPEDLAAWAKRNPLNGMTEFPPLVWLGAPDVVAGAQLAGDGRTLRDGERELNLQLARSNRLKDEFLASVTHELRTPMNGVIGSLELMHTLPMDTEMAQYHHTAVGSAQGMMDMVNAILTLSELQAGRLRAQPAPFSLRTLLQGLRAGYAGQALGKGLYLSLDIPADLPDGLLGDGQKLAHCLGCLVDNGLKFTHQGGVMIQVRGRRVGPDDLALTFTVSDSGIGFDDLEQSILYQRFFQVDGSMTRRYGGLGIGLSICRQMGELLGARLAHESTRGLGSRFELSLNVAISQVQMSPDLLQVRRSL